MHKVFFPFFFYFKPVLIIAGNVNHAIGLLLTPITGRTDYINAVFVDVSIKGVALIPNLLSLGYNLFLIC